MRKNIKNDNMRRLIIVLMLTSFAVTLCVPCVSAAQASGTCGNGLTWTLSVDGVLTISGNGAMKNYAKLSPAPWYELRENIRVIVVENGVSSIGNYAFYELTNVVSATLPNSVKMIGDHAFFGCVRLKMLTLGNGVQTLGESAFECCEALRAVRLPSSLKTIAKKAFYRCYSLQAIYIPASVTAIGNMVFAYCKGLVSADIRASISELPYWMFYGCESLSTVTLVGNITSISGMVFYNCNQLKTLNYGGSDANALEILDDIRTTSLENFSEYNIKYHVVSITEGKSTGSEITDDAIISNTTTVTTTQNATVSTTVTQSTDYNTTQGAAVAGKTQTSVSIDATLENKDGWNELLDAIEKSDDANIDNQKIQVGVNLNTEQEISGETLNALAGKDINLTIDMKDGSTVKIDCERLEKVDEEKTMEVTALSYTISSNDNPTKTQIKTIGDSKSFLLSFKGSSEFDFSPQIYIGKEYAYQTATLYQYIPGRGLSLLQTVMVDKSGQATYYLQSTKDTTQYLIALNVKDIDASTAIIPEDIAADYGDMMYYEKIEYVTTGVRMFMGLSLFQFGIAVFCVMLFLFVAVGIVMGILYRKKKLELYYQRLREQNG